MSSFFLIVALLLGVALIAVWFQGRRAARVEYIRSYTLPIGLFEKLRQKHPDLVLKDCQLVGHALRQYFLAYLKSGCRYVSMPSQVVDDLWHEFILYTKHYEFFCKHAFGRFMHHTPAVVLSSSQNSNAGLRRCWWYACKEENINPRKPTRLPLLFALDSKLHIPNGFRYATDCAGLRKDVAGAGSDAAIYCGGDFASASFDGGTDGFGDFSSSDGSACADGDASGCGGGCGGGGD